MTSTAGRVRRAVLGDEPILREVRLQALSDAPIAFGSTYEREIARTTEDWQQWMSPGVAFILYEPEGARGMVAGLRDENDPAVAHLMAMWVHPKTRGSGGADELVAAVVAWARSEGAKVVRLKVIQGNDRARGFYERMGFRTTGHEEIRLRDSRIEVQMERFIEPARMLPQDSLTLRRARAEDGEFAFRVLKETMRDYAVATWGTWLEEQSQRETVEQVSAGRTQIIELNGLPIGVQLVDRPGTHIQLVQLYIAKEFQRRGFGTQLLNRLFVEARDSNVPIRLRVLAVNPAKKLYERLGFVVVESTLERYFMEWVP
jgi:ribosomal protein S18 acetylase RimI-like enzyme